MLIHGGVVDMLGPLQAFSSAMTSQPRYHGPPTQAVKSDSIHRFFCMERIGRPKGPKGTCQCIKLQWRLSGVFTVSGTVCHDLKTALDNRGDSADAADVKALNARYTTQV